MHVRPDKPALKPADTRSSDPSSNHAIPTWASAGKPRVPSSTLRHSMNESKCFQGLLDPLVAKKPLKKIGLGTPPGNPSPQAPGRCAVGGSGRRPIWPAGPPSPGSRCSGQAVFVVFSWPARFQSRSQFQRQVQASPVPVQPIPSMSSTRI